MIFSKICLSLRMDNRCVILKLEREDSLWNSSSSRLDPIHQSMSSTIQAIRFPKYEILSPDCRSRCSQGKTIP